MGSTTGPLFFDEARNTSSFCLLTRQYLVKPQIKKLFVHFQFRRSSPRDQPSYIRPVNWGKNKVLSSVTKKGGKHIIGEFKKMYPQNAACSAWKSTSACWHPSL